jgi:hypothetical protein
MKIMKKKLEKTKRCKGENMLNINKNTSTSLKYLVIFFIYLFILKGNNPVFSQDKTADLARYTPSWIKEGFADAGATHEPWIFQVRRNKNFNQWQKEQYEYQTSEEYIKSLAEAGITVYHIYCYKGFGFNAEKPHMDKAAEAAKIAHRYGMKVDTYVQWNTMAYETFFAEVPEAETDLWYQIDVNGKPVMITYGYQQSFRYRPCFNHDGYMNYFKEKILRYAVEKVKTDFIHFDNFDYNDPSDADFNPATITAFRKYLKNKYTASERIERFGFENVSHILPPMWNNPNPAMKMVAVKDPVIQEWIDFRCRTLSTRLAECARFVRQLNKEIVIEVNCGGIEGGNRAWEYGINHPDLMQYTNVIWAEDLNFAKWKDGVAVGKFRNYKLGRTTNNFIMSYNHTPYDFAENLALNRTIASLGWDELDGIELKFLKFWLDHKTLYTQMKGAEKVAVLRSYPSMAYNTINTHVSINMAEQALQQRQIPFDIIFNEQLGRLDDYYVLVLANQESLSDKTAAKIKDFVKNGGGLVATDNTGMYDGWRRLRKDNLLKEMLSEIDPGKSKGRELDNEKKENGTYSFRYGKGRIIYIPELIRPEGEIKLGYFTNWMVPKNANELESAVYWAAGKRLPLTVTAPEWIGVSHDTQDKRDVVHLFNYNHEEMAAGITLQYKGKIGKARAVSPDDKGTMIVPFSEDDGITELRIPDFAVYLIVSLIKK